MEGGIISDYIVTYSITLHVHTYKSMRFLAH